MVVSEITDTQATLNRLHRLCMHAYRYVCVHLYMPRTIMIMKKRALILQGSRVWEGWGRGKGRGKYLIIF